MANRSNASITARRPHRTRSHTLLGSLLGAALALGPTTLLAQGNQPEGPREMSGEELREVVGTPYVLLELHRSCEEARVRLKSQAYKPSVDRAAVEKIARQADDLARAVNLNVADVQKAAIEDFRKENGDAFRKVDAEEAKSCKESFEDLDGLGEFISELPKLISSGQVKIGK